MMMRTSLLPLSDESSDEFSMHSSISDPGSSSHQRPSDHPAVELLHVGLQQKGTDVDRAEIEQPMHGHRHGQRPEISLAKGLQHLPGQAWDEQSDQPETGGRHVGDDPQKSHGSLDGRGHREKTET